MFCIFSCVLSVPICSDICLRTILGNCMQQHLVASSQPGFLNFFLCFLWQSTDFRTLLAWVPGIYWEELGSIGIADCLTERILFTQELLYWFILLDFIFFYDLINQNEKIEFIYELIFSGINCYLTERQ